MEALQHAEEVLHACGLRFDGYAYAETRAPRGTDAMDWLAALRDAFTHTLRVPMVAEDAHAALFAFQRGARNHGWFLDRSPESLAGPLLFLHLYGLPTPARWRFQDDADPWDRIAIEDKEEAAATVRRWLLWGTGLLNVCLAHPSDSDLPVHALFESAERPVAP